MTGCNDTAIRVDVPEDSIPTPVPPGWDGKNGFPTTVTVFTVTCEHISLGPYERGPISLVLESHGKMHPPDNCRKGDYTFLNILTRIILDDPEIAVAFQEKLGIPTSVGQLRLEPTGDRMASTTRVSWNVTGGEESWYQVHRAENMIAQGPRTFRYFWQAGENLGMIDFDMHPLQDLVDPSATPGVFKAPMLLAEVGLPMLVGIGGIDIAIFPQGTFMFFEGYECAKRLPPPS